MCYTRKQCICKSGVAGLQSPSWSVFVNVDNKSLKREHVEYFLQYLIGNVGNNTLAPVPLASVTPLALVV